MSMYVFICLHFKYTNLYPYNSDSSVLDLSCGLMHSPDRHRARNTRPGPIRNGLSAHLRPPPRPQSS